MYCSYLAIFVFLEMAQIALTKIIHDDSLLGLPSDEETKEPSCEELRKMWRHTKREMQQKTEMDPPRFKTRYQEPFSYGWKAAARPRNAMYSKPVYGRVVHSPDKFLYRNNLPNRVRSYDQVARMVGSSSGFYSPPQLTNAAKTTYFRLDYPVRRPVPPVPPVRLMPIGRFQELQNVLRSERAKELLQGMKLKENNDEGEQMNYNEESNSRFNTYPFSPPNEDDATAANGTERKLRGTDEGNSDSLFSHKSEESQESDNVLSTSKPVLTDDNIPRRWALGEWKR